jgi:fructose-1,6-bisphosphatase/inositol monophosphatase family enzyme
MPLNSNELHQLYQLACSAATKAGQAIRNCSGHTLEVHHKQAGSSMASQVVTEIDLISQKTILDTLAPTLLQYDLGLLTEEQEDDGSRLKKEHFWSIDPVDGTLSLIEALPGYAVSIALVSTEGRPLIGVVFDPVTETLYSAQYGLGAFINNIPWPLHEQNDHNELTLICDRSLLEHPNFQQISTDFTQFALTNGFSGLTTLGPAGAVMSAIWVARYQNSIYFKRPKKQQGGGCLWDFAATSCIFTELGFTSSDYRGEPLKLNHSDSVYMNQRGVLFSTNPRISNAARIIMSLISADSSNTSKIC